MLPLAVGNDLYENRTAVVDQLQQAAEAEVSIIVQAYGRLEQISLGKFGGTCT